MDYGMAEERGKGQVPKNRQWGLSQ